METRMKKVGLSLALVSLLAVAGCSDVGSPSSTTNPATGAGGGGTTTPTYTMTLASDLSKVPAGGTASITATILANGSPDLTLSPSVNFTSTCVAQNKATLDSPVTGAASIAVSTYTDKGCGATDTIVATATVDGQSLSQTLSLPVETLSIKLIAPTTLVGGSSTPISVEVYSGTSLYTSQSVPVTFSSACVSMNTATMNTSAFTNNGVATTTYTDKGCGIIDTLTATATVGGLTKSASASMSVQTVTLQLSAPATLVAGESTPIVATVFSGANPYTAAQVPVTFTSTCVAGNKATMQSTALTDTATGKATVTLSDNGCGITTDTIVATAQVGGVIVSNTASTLVKGFTLTVAPVTNPLAGGGSTQVTATVSNDNGTYTLQPAEVTFTSNCTTQGTATMTSPAFTSDGVATSTYTDAGCATTDTLQATAKLGAATITDTATLDVQALSMTLAPATATLAAGEVTTVTATISSGGTPLTTPVQVTFSSNCVTQSKAIMASSSFSDATGKATVSFTDDGCGPTVDTLTATAQVGGLTLTKTAPLTVTGFKLALSAPAFLAGGGSTEVTATVSNDNGTYTLKPAEVSFTSNCVVQGTATMTSPAFTSNGVAKSKYTDKGCATQDTLQATAKLGGATVSATTLLDVQTVAMTLVPAQSTLAAGGTTAVKATITSGGTPYATPVVVSFSSSCVSQSKASMASSSFTDAATGEASVNFTDNGCGPALDALTATAVVGGVVLTAGANLTIDPFTMTLAFPVGFDPAVGLSASATVPVTATIWSGATPYAQAVPVNFTSSCVAQTKATMDDPVYTSNGAATSNYTDKGCAATDNLLATATVGGAALNASTTLKVASATAGSISFVSATPSSIGIKGAGLAEASEVKFQVVSGTGIPLQGQTVSFSLDNTQGGITYTPTSIVSDANGYASTTVSSGTAATTVRVKATAITPTGTTLQTLSDGLVISTGVSDQDSFSLSASLLNPEGYDIDGAKVTLNIYAADAFNNPVPDNSAIYFTTEGGQVTPSCLTANGGCSVEWTSANPRPAPGSSHYGRITILATMVGEESFIDQNGNNFYDDAESGTLVDVPEAWRDDNENNVWDSNEVYRDFNSDGIYNVKDGKYSGVLCDSAVTLGCATAKSVEVRQDIVLVMAESHFSMTFDVGTYTVGGGPVGGKLTVCGVQTGGFPPAGTKITAVTTNGKITLLGGDTVPNAVPPGPPASLPPEAQCYVQYFTVENDTDPTKLSGVATFSATTPGGTVNFATIPVVD